MASQGEAKAGLCCLGKAPWVEAGKWYSPGQQRMRVGCQSSQRSHLTGCQMACLGTLFLRLQGFWTLPFLCCATKQLASAGVTLQFMLCSKDQRRSTKCEACQVAVSKESCLDAE